MEARVYCGGDSKGWGGGGQKRKRKGRNQDEQKSGCFRLFQAL